jgi:hypothetical protein
MFDEAVQLRSQVEGRLVIGKRGKRPDSLSLLPHPIDTPLGYSAADR